MKVWLAIVLVGLALPLPAQVVIQPFAANGVLTWQSSFTNAAAYAVEWAPTVTGPWSRSWTNLANVSPLSGSNSIFTVNIPMFYRVAVISACDLPGDCCDSPTVLADAGTFFGTTLGYSNNAAAGAKCAGTAGPDRFFSVTIPPGKRLSATVASRDGVFDPSISLQADCNSPRACLAGDDAGSAMTLNRVDWDNSAATPLPVLIVIDTYSSSSPGGPFELTVAFSDIPPGETCATATALVGATTLSNQSTVGYLNDSVLIGGCAAKSGPDRYYSITVPAGQKLTVTATPAVGFDCAITLSAGCPATGCLAQADTGGSGVAETTQYTNTAGTGQTVYIAIDSNTSTGSGSFTLTTTLGAP